MLGLVHLPEQIKVHLRATLFQGNNTTESKVFHHDPTLDIFIGDVTTLEDGVYSVWHVF